MTDRFLLAGLEEKCYSHVPKNMNKNRGDNGSGTCKEHGVGKREHKISNKKQDQCHPLQLRCRHQHRNMEKHKQNGCDERCI